MQIDIQGLVYLLLVLVLVVSSLSVRRASWPALIRQATIWVIIFVAAVLLVMVLRKLVDQPPGTPDRDDPVTESARTYNLT